MVVRCRICKREYERWNDGEYQNICSDCRDMLSEL